MKSVERVNWEPALWSGGYLVLVCKEKATSGTVHHTHTHARTHAHAHEGEPSLPKESYIVEIGSGYS